MIITNNVDNGPWHAPLGASKAAGCLHAAAAGGGGGDKSIYL